MVLLNRCVRLRWSTEGRLPNQRGVLYLLGQTEQERAGFLWPGHRKWWMDGAWSLLKSVHLLSAWVRVREYVSACVNICINELETRRCMCISFGCVHECVCVCVRACVFVCADVHMRRVRCNDLCEEGRYERRNDFNDCNDLNCRDTLIVKLCLIKYDVCWL